MKILIDENMPYAKQLFGCFGEVIAKAGRSMKAEDLIDIDALFCRSVTQVDKALLSKANKLKFVASATAGFDHIDLGLLAKKNIGFSAAPGCNKVGVAEYVLSALMLLAKEQRFRLTERKVGIVGAGMVGSYLADCLDAIKVPFMLCDPIKAQQGDPRRFYPLAQIIAQCDVISLHTPLSYEGEHATYHLFGKAQLEKLKAGSILINAARGKVVDNQALKKVLAQKSLTAILDVFEHEPLLDSELLPLLRFATPHIAGYGLEGKARGTVMVFNAFCDFLNVDIPRANIEALLPAAPFPRIELSTPWQEENLMSLCQLVYDIRRDDADFRYMMQDANKQRENFDMLRKNYWDRREYSAITLITKESENIASLAKLGFRLEEKK